MAKTRLRAWVKYSPSTGRIVPGILIVRPKKPSGNGHWVEIPSELCCSLLEIVPVT